MQTRAIGIAVLLVMSATRCGGSEDVSTSGQRPANVRVAISAESGGMVAGGGALLSIPGGALAADTEITLKTSIPASTLPSRATLEGQVYEFGPSDTHFQKPATLALSLPNAADPNGRFVISWLDTTSNRWADLSTTLDGTTVSAAIEHLSRFVIRFERRTKLDCSFTGCGGMPIGTWLAAEACGDFSGGSGIQSTCATAMLDTRIDATGVFTFRADQTYTSDLSITGSLVLSLPAACTTKLDLPSCDQIGRTCTGTLNEGCLCTVPLAPAGGAESGTWSVNGSLLEIYSATRGTVSRQEFCVGKDILKIKTQEERILVFVSDTGHE